MPGRREQRRGRVVAALLFSVLTSTPSACRGAGEGRTCPTSKRTAARAPGLQGRILFQGVIGGGVECLATFVMNADGTGVRRLIEPDVVYFSAKWSPDGRWIVY